MDLSDPALLARLRELPGSAVRLFWRLHQITTVYGGKIRYGLYVTGWMSFYYAWGGFKGLLYYSIIGSKFIWILLKLLFRYSNTEFIFKKFFPPKGSGQLPTGIIWLFGIYVGFWTLASERYEYKFDLIETRVNSIYAELGAADLRKNALGRVSEVQNMTCPERPDFMAPLSIVRSMLYEDVHKDMVRQLRQLLEDTKDQLDWVNISGADLSGARLGGAKLMGARLWDADLKFARLEGAKLEGAKLMNAKLMSARLMSTNLMGADLMGADLMYANLMGAEALTSDQLCEAFTLYRARLDPNLEWQTKDKCIERFNKPDEADLIKWRRRRRQYL